MADLLHLARSLDIEPDYVIRSAQGHFDTEVAEAAEKYEADLIKNKAQEATK